MKSVGIKVKVDQSLNCYLLIIGIVCLNLSLKSESLSVEIVLAIVRVNKILQTLTPAL